MPGKKNRPFEARFWSKVDFTPTCWNWTGCRDKRGYGFMGMGGRGATSERAHRISWTLANGEIPPGMNICHRCDNPSCVRPDHLFLGTQKENLQDCARKGRTAKWSAKHPERMARGSEHWNSKLTEDRVAEILQLCQGHRTMTFKEIGQAFAVSEATIRDIANGKAWKHVGHSSKQNSVSR